MDVDLINQDIEVFLKKYTRFMTKGIYMTNILYERFVNNYKYLYEEVERNIYLYKDSRKYKKMMSILKNKDKLIKLHNKKYLEDKVASLDNQIDKNIRKILLCEENRLLVMDNKYVELIQNKVRFSSKKNLLIITDSKERALELQMKIEGLENIYDIDTLGLKLLNYQYAIVDTHGKYQILSNYIKNVLYKDKYSFKKFSQVFKDGLYFNKDYLDYDTFHDYHNYMFKRMFLSSKTNTLDKFNKKMIQKRKCYLRTICDEVMLSQEEVDIANFLYLNSISYQYNKEGSYFTIYNGDECSTIKYLENDKKEGNFDIVLFREYLDKSKMLDHLVYELIKRRYPMELLDDNTIYNQLKKTCEDGYFSKLLSKTIIPLMEHYDDLSKSDMDVQKKNVIRDIYTYYKNYLNQNHQIDRADMIKLIKDKMKDSYHEVILLEGDKRELSGWKLDTLFDKSLVINYHYQSIPFISNSVQNIYDYKKYLNNYKKIPIPNVYIDYRELDNITNSFKKLNRDNIDKSFDKNKIELYSYDDSKRLSVGKNKSRVLNEIISNIKGSILVLGKSLQEKDILFDNNYFNIDGNSKITSKKNPFVSIDYHLIQNKASKIYDYIILNDMIGDQYDDMEINPIIGGSSVEVDMIIRSSYMKCRNQLIIMCPDSKIESIKENFV